MQAAGNHQVQNEPEIAFYSDGDSLADSAQLDDWATLDVGNRGLRGSKQKKTGQAHTLDWLREDARLKCADVGGDVREFRHAYELAGRGRNFANFWTAMGEVLLSSGTGGLRKEFAEEGADAVDHGRSGRWSFERGLLFLRGRWFRGFWWGGDCIVWCRGGGVFNGALKYQ